jgi:putative transposase
VAGQAPSVLRCDNGPESLSALIIDWPKGRDIKIEYIQPGKPQQNAYVERFNRTVRDEWLAQYCVDAITEVRDFATRLIWNYNHGRPNMALGRITPKQRLATVA